MSRIARCIMRFLPGRYGSIRMAALRSQTWNGVWGANAEAILKAIGTGLTPTAAEVAEVHAFIRTALIDQFGAQGREMRILYGGSVKPSNAAELLAVANVNGALVGGASLKAADLLGIIAGCKV